MIEKIKNFLSESRQELRQVTWPSREAAIRLTAVVIGLSLALAVFLGVFDFLFSYALRVFILKS